MRFFLLILFGAQILLVFFAVLFPLMFAGQAVLNTTTNLSQYEGMPEAVSVAPFIVLFLIIFVIFWFWIKRHNQNV